MKHRRLLVRVCEKMGQARSLMLFIQGFLDIDDEPVPFFHKLSGLEVCRETEPATSSTGRRSGNGGRFHKGRGRTGKRKRNGKGDVLL